MLFLYVIFNSCLTNSYTAVRNKSKSISSKKIYGYMWESSPSNGRNNDYCAYL